MVDRLVKIETISFITIFPSLIAAGIASATLKPTVSNVFFVIATLAICIFPLCIILTAIHCATVEEVGRHVIRLIDADILRDETLHDSEYDNDTINHFLDLVDCQPTVDKKEHT